MKTRSAQAFLRSCVLLTGVLAACLGVPAARADERPTVRVPAPAAALPAEKLLSLQDGRDLRVVDLPGHVLPPHAAALGCGAPQTVGTIQATHPYYDVYLDSGGGSFTARTGASHSVTALAGGPQNVIYGGSYGSPGTSDATWHFHAQGANPAVTYSDPGSGSACAFDPPDTAMEPASVGIEQEFHVSPRAGVTCTLRQEIVAFGTTEANSGVRLTLATTNDSTSVESVNVGVRWQIDYQNGGDDGPLFAPVVCDPPSVGAELSSEHEFLPSEIRDFYRIQNNAGTPIFSNVTSTTGIGGIPDTGTPDRLVYGRWGSMVSSPWDYISTEGACCPDSDSAVLWYHGYLPADGDVLAPGQTSRHSIVIFTSNAGVSCGTFTPGCATSIASPPQDQTICAGDTATLDASGITLTDCAGTTDYTWTDGVSVWTTPVIAVSPSATTTYAVTVQCSADPSCRASFSATVAVERPPEFLPPIGIDPDDCNNGVKITWNDAVFHGATGTGMYNVYRSEVSCADALLHPLASGLGVPTLFDPTTESGHTYYYVVEAEDRSPAVACSPTGPGGGAVTRLCATVTDDMIDMTVPAVAGPVLFARHSGDQVTLYWTGLRPLLAGEHSHLLKSWLDPRSSFTRVNPEADLSTSFTETDTSAWLQFFDLRVANSCERISSPEYGPQN